MALNIINLTDVAHGDPSTPTFMNATYGTPINANFSTIKTAIENFMSDENTFIDESINGTVIVVNSLPGSRIQDDSISGAKVDSANPIPETKLALDHSTADLNTAIANLGQGSNYSAILSEDAALDISSPSYKKGIFGIISDNEIVRTHTEVGKENIVFIDPFDIEFMGKRFQVYNEANLSSPGVFEVSIGAPKVAENESSVNLMSMKLYHNDITAEVAADYVTALNKYKNIFLDMKDEGSGLAIKVYAVAFEFSYNEFSTADESEVKSFLNDRAVPAGWSLYNNSTNGTTTAAATGMYHWFNHDTDNHEDYFVFPVALYTRGNNLDVFKYGNSTCIKDGYAETSTHLIANDIKVIFPRMKDILEIEKNIAKDLKEILAGDKAYNFSPIRHKENEHSLGDAYNFNWNFFSSKHKRMDTLSKAGNNSVDFLDTEVSIAGDYLGLKTVPGYNFDIDNGYMGFPMSRLNISCLDANVLAAGKDIMYRKIQAVLKISADASDSITLVNDGNHNFTFGWNTSGDKLVLHFSQKFLELITGVETDGSIGQMKALIDTNTDIYNGSDTIESDILIKKYTAATNSVATITVGSYTYVASSGLNIEMALSGETIAENNIYYLEFPIVSNSNLGFNFPVNNLMRVEECARGANISDLVQMAHKEDVKYRGMYALPINDDSRWLKIKGSSGMIRMASNVDLSNDFSPTAANRGASNQVSNLGIAIHPQDVFNSLNFAGGETYLDIDHSTFGLPEEYAITGIAFESADLNVTTNPGLSIDSVVCAFNELHPLAGGPHAIRLNVSASGAIVAGSVFNSNANAVIYVAPKALFDISIVNNGIKRIMDFETKLVSVAAIDNANAELVLSFPVYENADLTDALKVYAGAVDTENFSQKALIYAEQTGGTGSYLVPIKKIETLCDGSFVKLTLDTVATGDETQEIVRDEAYTLRFIHPRLRLEKDLNTVFTYEALAAPESLSVKYFADNATDFEKISDMKFVFTNAGSNVNDEVFAFDRLNLKNLFFKDSKLISRVDKSAGSYQASNILEEKSAPIYISKDSKNVNILEDSLVAISSHAENLDELLNDLSLKIFNIKDMISGNIIESDKAGYNIDNMTSNSDFQAALIAYCLVRNKATREIKLMIAIDPILDNSHGTQVPFNSASPFTQYYISDLDSNYVN